MIRSWDTVTGQRGWWMIKGDDPTTAETSGWLAMSGLLVVRYALSLTPSSPSCNAGCTVATASCHQEIGMLLESTNRAGSAQF